MEPRNNQNTVLITGATSGIGLELAKLFARDNYHIVAVARTSSDLMALEGYLLGLGAETVMTLTHDLSLPSTAQELFNETLERGVHVDILVNNAGVGEHGLFKDSDLQKELDIIQLNVSSVVHLTKLYLKEMVKAGKGKILQLASAAAYQPIPKLAVYAATKSFILSFTDALQDELEDTGVSVTTLIPGATDTDFFHKAGMENTVTALGDLENPEVVARLGYEGLMKGERHVLCPGVRKIVVMSSFLPNNVLARQAEKSMEEKENSKQGRPD